MLCLSLRDASAIRVSLVVVFAGADVDGAVERGEGVVGLVQFCGRSFGLGTWSNVAEHMRVYYAFGGVAAGFLHFIF